MSEIAWLPDWIKGVRTSVTPDIFKQEDIDKVQDCLETLEFFYKRYEEQPQIALKRICSELSLVDEIVKKYL